MALLQENLHLGYKTFNKSGISTMTICKIVNVSPYTYEYYLNSKYTNWNISRFSQVWIVNLLQNRSNQCNRDF